MADSTRGTSNPGFSFNLANVHETEESVAARGLLKSQSSARDKDKFKALTNSSKLSESDINRTKQGNKAVLNFLEMEGLPKAQNTDSTEPVVPIFNLIDGEKINAVIPPGRTITLNFDMDIRLPNETRHINTDITLHNAKGNHAKLVSFAFDENGQPMMRGDKHEMSRDNTERKKRHFLGTEEMKQYKGTPNVNEYTHKGFYVDLNKEGVKEFSKDVDAKGLKQLHPDSQIPKHSAEIARRLKNKDYHKTTFGIQNASDKDPNQATIGPEGKVIEQHINYMQGENSNIDKFSIHGNATALDATKRAKEEEKERRSQQTRQAQIEPPARFHRDREIIEYQKAHPDNVDELLKYVPLAKLEQGRQKSLSKEEQALPRQYGLVAPKEEDATNKSSKA
ncbi:MAG: hypothetical protein CMD81_15050 [Gammaproteobacteria bacterium]|nr:hypothetical protein [Gammaproteobacteria bacterium]HBF09551.1 hypothetical protein [Gammaproteobacteria bacterium]|tara:strand:- start:1015 stop:2196 length:1182 start_codon:yes stop_codon:yes gene_type:complete